VDGECFAALAAATTGTTQFDNTVRGVELKSGDVLRVEGTSDGSDPAALDYVEVHGHRVRTNAMVSERVFARSESTLFGFHPSSYR